MKSKVTTRKGDKGYTMMWSKEIISKDDERIEALGTIDELIAWIGVICSSEHYLFGRPLLLEIQQKLSKACAEIMDTKTRVCVNYKDDVRFLDKLCKEVEKGVDLPNGWWFQPDTIIPSAKFFAGHFNYARVLTRKCERNIVKVLNHTELNNKNLIKFFNRLSDLFYLWTILCDGRTKKQ